MGDAPNDACEGGTSEPPSSEPDTEPGVLPMQDLTTEARAAPTPSSDSLNASVDMESSGKTARTTLSDGTRFAAVAPSRGDSKQAKVPAKEHSSTTLQSMMKPDASASGIPHTRRFLRIENDLDQTTAAARLLEKRLCRVQKESRIALFLAILALVVAVVVATLVIAL